MIALAVKAVSRRVLLTGVLCLLILTGVWVLAAPSFNTIVDPGGMMSEATYILTVDGTDYYCKHGKTGAITTDTNATTLIQYAIDNANSGAGGLILLRQGSYSIDGTITLDDYISLVGETELTTLTWAGGAAPVIDIPKGTTNVHIESLAIYDDPVAPQATYGIKMEGDGANGIYNVVIRNVYMDPAPDDRGLSAKYCENAIFENLYMGMGMGASLDEYGVYLSDSNYVTFDSVRIFGGDYGLFIGSSFNVIVSGGYIGESGEAELSVDTCETVTIQGVRMIHGSATDQNAILDGSGIVFSGNYLGSSKNGTVVKGGSVGVVIQGNYFYDVDAAGYDVVVEATAVNTLISHNTLSTNGIDDGGTSTRIVGNYDLVTENCGTSTVASGSTTKVVAHGLDYTPTTANTAWTVTPTEVSTNDAGPFAVSAMNITHVTFSVLRDPGASNLDFSWYARRVP